MSGAETKTALTVEYFHSIPNGHANIIWAKSWPMRGGRFPDGHPVGGCGPDASMQFGQSDQMIAFRAIGYWASCFPEGDGITLTPPDGRDAKAVAKDIEACFGWRVRVKRS